MSSPSASSALPMAATVAPPPVRGMGFNFLPRLPIILRTFGFLKSPNLRSVGLELGDVPIKFGWDLVLFEPTFD